MAKIFKYSLEITDRQVVFMPMPIKVLSAQIQNGNLFLWVLVTEGEPETPIMVRIVGTGHQFDDWSDWLFVDTVQQGPFVWHIFFKDPNK